MSGPISRNYSMKLKILNLNLSRLNNKVKFSIYLKLHNSILFSRQFFYLLYPCYILRFFLSFMSLVKLTLSALSPIFHNQFQVTLFTLLFYQFFERTFLWKIYFLCGQNVKTQFNSF